MGNPDDKRHLKRVLRQILRKIQRVGFDIDPAFNALLVTNLPSSIDHHKLLTFFQEIDAKGEFPSKEEAGKFIDFLGMIFSGGVELRANPQVEDGFTKIANEIMEALARTRIPGEARQVLDFTLRKTFGWQKKEDSIPLSQIVLGTGLKKPNVCRAIRKLLGMNLIIVKDKGDDKTYRLQKDYTKWRPLSKKITLSKKIIKQGESLSKKITSKESIKETYNGRSQKQTDPRVKDFFSYWGETFQRETDQPYIFSYGKEGKLTKDLLKVHSIETLQEVTRAFFKDEQCKRRGLTIGIFFQEINKLLSVKAMNPLEQAKRELARGVSV